MSLFRVFLLLLLPMQAWAAGQLELFDSFHKWIDDGSDIKLDYSVSETASRIEFRLRDQSGTVLYREELFNIDAGVHGWQPGEPEKLLETVEVKKSYLLELRANFVSGNSVSRTVRVEFLEKERITPRGGFVPPAVEYVAPSHVIKGGYWAIYRNPEASPDDFENRAYLSYRDESDQHQIYAKADYYEGKGVPESTRGSQLAYAYNKGNLYTQVLYRRQLSSFDDPLRIFSDFKLDSDKVAINAYGSNAGLYARGLAFDTEAGQRGGAARIKLPVSRFVEWGLSSTFLTTDANGSANADGDNLVLATDLLVSLPANNAVSLQYASTDVSDASDEALEGRDEGGKVAWVNRAWSGYELSLGYLELGEDYRAELSDPGALVTSDIKGPEASLSISRYGVTSWADVISINSSAYSYERSTGETLDLVDISTNLDSGELSFNLAGRQSEESGVRVTSWSVGEENPLWGLWRSGVRYEKSETSTAETDRLSLDLNCHRCSVRSRLTLEGLMVENTQSGDAEADEYSLLGYFSREAWFADFAIRRSHTKGQSPDLGGHLSAGRSWIYWRRYKPSLTFTYGNRASQEFEKDVEVKVQLDF